MLSSYFIGYLVTQLPGGWLTARYGGKWVLALAVFFTSVVSVFEPMCARWSINAMIAVQLLKGLASVSKVMHSIIIPQSHTTLIAPSTFNHNDWFHVYIGNIKLALR